jgi:Plasmid pRiA4b ORF-3-like protein
MNQPSTQPHIYQLRMVLRGISPLIWRRVLVCIDTTLAHLHAMLQILFTWSDEHLHSFHIHGREYGSSGANASHVRLSDLRLHRGERFRYVYDFGAHWECDIRLEAILPLAPRRVYPVCIGGKRAAPPEDCWGAWAYMERLDQHRLYPPLDAMGVVANAISTLLEAGPQTLVRAALGDLDELREAVDCLETYQAFQPDHFDHGDINRQLLAWGQEEGAVRCR